MIGAIVLAAGSSRRFGDDKRKATLPNGKLIVQQSTLNALACFDAVTLVLRYGDNEFAEELSVLIDNPGLTIFLAPDSALGMGHSLANAMDEVRGWVGAFIFLGDMPYIRRDTIQQLIAAFSEREAEQPIIVPAFEKKWGHPVGFHAAHFEALSSLTGDQGAKPVLQTNQQMITEVKVDDPGILRDVDTPADLSDPLQG